MTEDLAMSQKDKDAIEKAVLYADYSDLTQDQRMAYIQGLCRDYNLDYRLTPIRFLTLDGKLVPYAMKSCTDQLRKANGISIQITEQRIMAINGEDNYVVTVRSVDAAGRYDEDMGAVPIGGNVGVAVCNAMKKAVTQAKRRVTLSHSGLTMLDESEISSVPGAKVVEPSKGPERIIPPPVLPTLPSPAREAPAAPEEPLEATIEPPMATTSSYHPPEGDPDHPAPVAGTVPVGHTVRRGKMPPAAAPIKVGGVLKAKV